MFTCSSATGCFWLELEDFTELDEAATTLELDFAEELDTLLLDFTDELETLLLDLTVLEEELLDETF